MADTHTVGSLSSYETILAKVQQVPETELRKTIKKIEAKLPYWAAGFKFVKDDE